MLKQKARVELSLMKLSLLIIYPGYVVTGLMPFLCAQSAVYSFFIVSPGLAVILSQSITINLLHLQQATEFFPLELQTSMNLPFPHIGHLIDFIQSSPYIFILTLS